MFKNRIIYAQCTQQHTQEQLQPLCVPTLPCQLVSHNLFELNGLAHVVTMDHYSDYYELDRLPRIQSSAVVQGTRLHFGCNGALHSLTTVNGPQITSELFKTLGIKYGFNYITS